MASNIKELYSFLEPFFEKIFPDKTMKPRWVKSYDAFRKYSNKVTDEIFKNDVKDFFNKNIDIIKEKGLENWIKSEDSSFNVSDKVFINFSRIYDLVKENNEDELTTFFDKFIKVFSVFDKNKILKNPIIKEKTTAPQSNSNNQKKEDEIKPINPMEMLENGGFSDMLKGIVTSLVPNATQEQLNIIDKMESGINNFVKSPEVSQTFNKMQSGPNGGNMNIGDFFNNPNMKNIFDGGMNLIQNLAQGLGNVESQSEPPPLTIEENKIEEIVEKLEEQKINDEIIEIEYDNQEECGEICPLKKIED